MGLTASQIRQDLNCFGGFGQQGYGYHVSMLRQQLEHILGLDLHIPAILVGAGNLGRVVANNISFADNGFCLIGIFDNDPAVCGTTIAGFPVQPRNPWRCFARSYIRVLRCFVFRRKQHRKWQNSWFRWESVAFGITAIVIWQWIEP